MKKILLIGGGHSHVEVVRKYGLAPIPGAEVTLVSESHQTAYSGMVPGLIAGHYSIDECHINLETLCKKSKIKFFLGKVEKVYPETSLVVTNSGTEINFDIASIDTGSAPNAKAILGAETWSAPVKPINRLMKDLDTFEKKLQGKPNSFTTCITAVGGGAASVELLLAIHYRLLHTKIVNVKLTLITDRSDILPEHSLAVRRRVRRHLYQSGVTILTNARVTEICENSIVTESHGTTVSHFTILGTGASAPDWPKACGFLTDRSGFILTDENLLTLGFKNIFAVGDIGSILEKKYPKSGVYAVKQGPLLFKNIRSLIEGKSLSKFQPQSRALALISLGIKKAVASRGVFYASGAFVWFWKNLIDKRFMRRYQ